MSEAAAFASPAVAFISRALGLGYLPRARVETVVLKLASWRDYGGLGCPSGQMGFPGPGMLASTGEPRAPGDHTPEQRAEAWRRDVGAASDQLLAEAWCHLWSRQPPAGLGDLTPPGIGWIGEPSA